MKSFRPLALLFAVALSSCGTPAAPSPAASDSSATTQRVEIAPGAKEIPGHGQIAVMLYGAVTGTKETPANGIATIHIAKDGFSVVGAQINIAAAKDGTFYEAWLETADGTDRISLGHLTSPTFDARHALRYEAQKDLRSYGKFRLTLEADDGNPEPSADVATGILKPSGR